MEFCCVQYCIYAGGKSWGWVTYGWTKTPNRLNFLCQYSLCLSIVRDSVTTGEKFDMEFTKRQIRWRKYGGRAQLAASLFFPGWNITCAMEKGPPASRFHSDLKSQEIHGEVSSLARALACMTLYEIGSLKKPLRAGNDARKCEQT